MTSAAVETTPLTCDVLVVGSGAAGLAAAVTAAWHGRRVVLVEKDPVFGGASAWSGGWAWLPRNPLARRAGIEEDIEQPRTYLRHELGERYDAARIDAFLEACPHMVAFFERHTHLRFVDGNGIPDMHGDTPGAAEGGHQLVAAPYDARQLGPLLPRLRKTLRETSFMGMPIMAGADLAAFLDLTRSLPAFLHVARRFSSHLWHLLRYGRAMHLVNGVALVARLAKSAEALGVRLIESAPARELLLRDGKVVGALVESAEGLLRIEAGAVVLACGGFPHDPQRRAELAPTLDTLLPLPPPGCNGDGLRLGESAGGRVADDLRSPIAWAPVSRVPHGDGETGHFPHIIERGKPGLIGVLANGRRFVNEAHGYHDYVAALLEATPPGQPARSWLVCDRRFLRRCQSPRTCAAAISSAGPAWISWQGAAASTRPAWPPPSPNTTATPARAATQSSAAAARHSTASRATRRIRGRIPASPPSNADRTTRCRSSPAASAPSPG